MRLSFGSAVRSIVKWMFRRGFPRSFEKKAFLLINDFLSQRDHYVVSFRPEHRWISQLIQSVRRERDLLIRNDEAANLAFLTAATSKVDGDLAEVGCYQGGSAKIISEAKGNRPLHLFDTFEGLPNPGEFDESVFSKGKFKCELEEVQLYLAAYPNVHFYKGLFPSTADAVSNRTFAFVNLDVDLHESTRSALEFFYPRMQVGGILVSHDYATSGVRRAFDEFFEDKPEVVIPLLGNQCMVVRAGAVRQSDEQDLAALASRARVAQADAARSGRQ